MTKGVAAAGPEMSVSEIAGLLLDHEISAVPVIGKERCVLGIVAPARNAGV